MYSMQFYYDLISKMKSMEEISHDLYPNYWKEKKSTKLNQSSNIDDEVKDTSIISNGKAIPSLKQHGKMNLHFLTMETCWNSTKYVIKSDIFNNLCIIVSSEKSTPILKTSSTLIDENEQLNQNINYLQTMIDDMIKEYKYMDQPLKYPREPEPSPITSMTDKSIFLNQ